MAAKSQTDLHFELERSISRRVDSKLIPYQVSISDDFYDRYTNLWNEKFSKDFVVKHRSFYAQLSKHCIYENLETMDKKAVAKRLAELEALADISETKEEFNTFFKKKYNKELPDLTEWLYPKKQELSDFDKKLWTAMHYNPRGD